MFAGPVYVPEEMTAPITEDVAHVEVVDNSAELSAAIEQLQTCSTKAELTRFKKELPAYIVEDASFKAAGMERYNVIMASAIKETV